MEKNLFSEAYEKCLDQFLRDGYKGVGTIFVSEDAWLFCPLIDGYDYDTHPIIFPKNGDEPCLFKHTPEEIEKYMNKAIELEL
ncbi:MAG: hypothetical protein Q4B85_14140 [Lachnospiraceae bacterium]|nr:hypothetical protein [Lachnospiraceae bacterium]